LALLSSISLSLIDLPIILGLEAVEPIEEATGLLKEPGPVLVAVGF